MQCPRLSRRKLYPCPHQPSLPKGICRGRSIGRGGGGGAVNWVARWHGLVPAEAGTPVGCAGVGWTRSSGIHPGGSTPAWHVSEPRPSSVHSTGVGILKLRKYVGSVAGLGTPLAWFESSAGPRCEHGKSFSSEKEGFPVDSVCVWGADSPTDPVRPSRIAIDGCHVGFDPTALV